MAKIAVGIRVEAEMLNRLRNAAWHIGQGLTITSVTISAIEDAVAKLERRNGGKPFPPRNPKRKASVTPTK